MQVIHMSTLRLTYGKRKVDISQTNSSSYCFG